MKLLTKALAMALLAVAFAAAPVAAATPYEVTIDVTYTIVNPCTGLTMEATFHAVYLVAQDNENRYVGTSDPSKSWGYTSDGYTEVGGEHETIALNTNGGVSNPNVTLMRNPDNGSMFIYRQMFRYNEATQQVVIARADLTCLGKGS
jgi:hypothetical protein